MMLWFFGGEAWGPKGGARQGNFEPTFVVSLGFRVRGLLGLGYVVES